MLLCEPAHCSHVKPPSADDFGTGPDSISPYAASVDIWSLGIIMLQLCLVCQLSCQLLRVMLEHCLVLTSLHNALVQL